MSGVLPGELFLQGGNSGLKMAQLFSRPDQNIGLNIEFLARHQIEPGKSGGHDGAHVFFHIAYRAVLQHFAHTTGNFIKDFSWLLHVLSLAQ